MYASLQGCKPDVSIFNSMIAACAHGGEFNKARLMFERMAEHKCVADAVTYANLIRAYKKGGQWCHALDTFEAMQVGYLPVLLGGGGGQQCLALGTKFEAKFSATC